MVKDFKFIITGCGRSGTAFIAHMFNENNYDCGHEKYFTVFGEKIKRKSECSWMATPHINKYKNSKFIRVYREPLLTIKSFVDLSFFDKQRINSPYIKFIQENIDGIDINKKSDIENAIIYYIEWNKLFDKLIGDRYYESINFGELIKVNNLKIFHKKMVLPKKIINKKDNYKKKNIKPRIIKQKIAELGYLKEINKIYHNLNIYEHRKI